ncbi:PREDICTED: citrate synthase 4, mitochondrial-like [Camelina sativa]|uniref:Citrate synthase n=1 Tax=Camelina sativa TaxID=90675 RepID=A0ABM1RPG0_CAMSA|nr:PREDICTED: citrate synthase 4, mitochondrial-like [Camelina sativa]
MIRYLISKFQKSSKRHMRIDFTSKSELTYEDCLNLIARVPVVAAYVYRRMYKNGDSIPSDTSLDYGANLFSHMLGFGDEKMKELTRLYITIHSNHEGENLFKSSIYEVLWIKSAVKECGENISKEQLIWQREFALKHLPDDPLLQLVSKLYDVVPPCSHRAWKGSISIISSITGGTFHVMDYVEMAYKSFLLCRGQSFTKLCDPVLTELRKNPSPNVDAHSGVLSDHYGRTEARYYTVLFGA